MGYQPSLKDITQPQTGYRPSLSDIRAPSLLQQAGNAAQTYINDPVEALANPIRDFSSGALQGIANIVPGIGNLGIHAYNGLTGSDAKPFKAFDFAPDNAASLSGQVASYFTPMGAEKVAAEVPEISNLAAKANEAVSGLLSHPSVAPKLSATSKAIQETPLVKQVYNGLTSDYAKGIGKNALQGAIFSPDNQAMGAALGAGFGAAVPPVLAAGKAILHPYDAIAKLFRGGLSKEELAANMEAAKGTETGLGRIIESPSLNRTYENYLPHFIGSGAEDSMQRTANNITQQGNQILENIGGKDAGNINHGEIMQKGLKQASKEASEEKTQGYKILDKAAEQAGYKATPENMSAKAQEILDKINKSEKLKRKTNPELISDLEYYAKNKDADSLESTNIFRGTLGEDANNAYVNGRKFEHGVYKALKTSLDKDIKAGFDETGNPDLIKMYKQQQKDFKEKYLPFEDKDIVKFTRRGGDPDLLLSHFLKGGRNDRGTLLSKLTNTLSPEQSQIPLHAYLSRAVEENGKVNPIKMAKLYRDLGKNQKNALIKDNSVKEQLHRFTELTRVNGEAFDLMRNPKTGARNLDFLLKIGTAAAGGPLPLIASTLATGAASRSIKNMLTSEPVREKIIKAMLRNEPGQIMPRSLQQNKLGQP